MEPVCHAEAVRAAERPLIADDAGRRLMLRAADAVAAVTAEVLAETPRRSGVGRSGVGRAGVGRAAVSGARVLVVAGAGHNGGDALFAGARLAAEGAHVWIAAVAGEPHAAALQACRAAGAELLDPQATLEAITGGVDCVLDGILGIGGRPGLDGAAAEVAQACRQVATEVIAVDLPSGLAADHGRIDGPHMVATRTVTFGVRKPCHVQQPAAGACGEVRVVDIGLGAVPAALELTTRADLARWWPVPDGSSDKYSRGVVGVDAGSGDYPGAGLLATLGAACSGAGMVRFLGPADSADLITAQAPQVVHAPGRVQARVLGPGWGNRGDADRVVGSALESGEPVVIDADALRQLPTGRLPAGVLLTPHAGELARLLGWTRTRVTDEPLTALAEAVRRTGATVLLKGGTQYVQGPDDPLPLVAVPGPAWTAQAGSGDVLAGVCGTLLAAGLPPTRAALAAASIQALTAAARPGPYPPQEVARQMPGVIAALVTGDRPPAA